MNKRSCINCKYLIDSIYCKARSTRITSSNWFECGCPHFEKRQQTVFDCITESEEALAESVVMPIIVEYSGDILWVSPLLQKDASKRAIFFDSKSEAIAATIEELNKEYREKSK